MKNRNIVDTVSHGKYYATIEPDEGPNDSPRDWSNLGIMVCFHRRYNLGDEKTGYRESDFQSWDELADQIKKDHKPVIMLPLRLYDHSGISMQAGQLFGYPYNDSWDSGIVGFIFAPREAVLKEYSCKRVSAAIRAKVEKVLRQEVETYDDYLTGNVYGYRLFRVDDNFDPDKDDPEDYEELDSCWGFYGDTAYIKQEVKDLIEAYEKEDNEKAWASVPLEAAL